MSLPDRTRCDALQPGRRIETLDSLRGIAALAIMLFHYEAMLPPYAADHAVEGMKLRYAMLAIELFFVISGFVILATISRSASMLDFSVRRAARIYPAYWLSVVFAAAVLIWDGQDVLGIAAVNLTMFQSFVFVKGLIPPYWTLAYELWFYVVVALLLHLELISLLPALSAVWLIVAFVVRLLGFHAYGLAGILSMLPFGQFFIAGMMIYKEHRADGTRLTRAVLLGCLLYCGFGREDWSHVSGPIYLTAAAACFTIVYFAAGRKLEILRTRCLVRIGEVSYSLYLLHFPVALLCIHLCQQAALPVWPGVVAAIPLSIIVAAASRRWIEVPGQNAFVYRLDGRREYVRARGSGGRPDRA